MGRQGIDFVFPKGQHTIDEVYEPIVAAQIGGEKIERSLGTVGSQGAFRSQAYLVGDDVLEVKHWPQVEAADSLLHAIDIDEGHPRGWHGPVAADEVLFLEG